MGLVMLHAKETGKKKPLSSFIAAATLPKGGVLLSSIYKPDMLSRTYCSERVSKIMMTDALNNLFTLFSCNYYFSREGI